MIRCLSVCLISCSLVLFSACVDDAFPAPKNGGTETLSRVVATAAAVKTQTTLVNPIGGIIKGDWRPVFGVDDGTARGFVESIGPDARIDVPLTLHDGDRIVDLATSIIGTNTATVTITVFGSKPDGTVAERLGELAMRPAAGAWSDVAIDLVDTTVANGTTYWIQMTADQLGIHVGTLWLTSEI